MYSHRYTNILSSFPVCLQHRITCQRSHTKPRLCKFKRHHGFNNLVITKMIGAYIQSKKPTIGFNRNGPLVPISLDVKRIPLLTPNQISRYLYSSIECIALRYGSLDHGFLSPISYLNPITSSYWLYMIGRASLFQYF